ncbi:MAG: metal-sulfur cluster assembly factor [Thermodesulfobacteriota bacterium]
MGFGKMISGLFKKEENGETPVLDHGRGDILTDGAENDGIQLTKTPEPPPGNSATREAPSNKSVSGSPDTSSAVKAPSADTGSEKLSEEKVLEVLSNVYDPEIPIDIVNLGLVYGIEIDGGNVRISMTMTAPGCPASTQIAGESKILIEELPGVKSVEIDVVWDPPWDPSKMSEEAQQSLGIF